MERYEMKKRVLAMALATGLVVSLAVPWSVSANGATAVGKVNGGGLIETGTGEDAAKITFGGNLNDLGGQPVGHWNIVFHNVNNDDLDMGQFHPAEITFLEFKNLPECPGADPPDSDYNRANFRANGRFNNEDGWCIEVRLADHGEGRRGQGNRGMSEMDSIRILLWDADGDLQYDSYEGGSDYQGDFPDETECAGTRAILDSGNFQIRARGTPE
jgi:hypothetical protein